MKSFNLSSSRHYPRGDQMPTFERRAIEIKQGQIDVLLDLCNA